MNMNTLLSAPEVSDGQLAANIAGDALGLPGGLGTHFTNIDFARSALPTILPHVEAAYPAGGQLRVISLCGGEAFYERVACEAIRDELGLKPGLIVVDLQRASLQRIPETPFPVMPIHTSVTRLPFNSECLNDYGEATTPTLVLSRAFEHYLSPADIAATLHETGRILRPGEIYAPQLTSGDPKTLGALSAAVEAVAAKDVGYLSVDQYRGIVNGVRQEDGAPLFAVRGIGQAETQTGRGALAQARRYLNETFLALHANKAGANLETYQQEITQITTFKSALEIAVHFGTYTPEVATQLLDDRIKRLHVYDDLFQPIYVEAVTAYLNAQDAPPERGTTIVRDQGGAVVDVLLDIEYPIVVLEKRPPNDHASTLGGAVGTLVIGSSYSRPN